MPAIHATFKAATGQKSDGDVTGFMIMNYINEKASVIGVIVQINISRFNSSISGIVVTIMTA